MSDTAAQRPGSLRSVASNSSIASGVSLARRQRTRLRSKTLTGNSDEPPLSPTSELPYLGTSLVQEPLQASELFPEAQQFSVPPHLQHRLEVENDLHLRGSSASNSELSEQVTAEATFVDVQQLSVTSIKPKPHSLKQPSNFSKAASYKPPPSAFSRDPETAPNVRDSMSTHQSGASSSIYPPSTSTASGAESPQSPHSIEMDVDDINPFPPEVNDLEEYDNDDVAYRLRLLVKNSYFLPPAHSKPSPSDFATSTNASKKAARPSPGFLDIFRGKSKSKPNTPTSTSPGFDLTSPILRTTSDSITVLRSQPRPSFQSPRISPHPPGNAPMGRVVVVREKMNDINVAARQAEQDLKSRGVPPPQGSQKGKQSMFDEVIDPTDAVDLPLPSSAYPFAVQASALHGLGVSESVGAAVLADRLPPPQSPNMSSSYDTEDDWRKALLHEAVHHSLDTTPDISSFSHVQGASTPLGSPRVRSPDTSRGATPPVRLLIQKRILEMPLRDSTEVSSDPADPRRKSTQSQASTSKANATLAAQTYNSLSVSRPSSYLPMRAETPSGPMTPLSPAPRKHFVNPLYSHSQTDLRSPSGKGKQPSGRRSVSPTHTLRKAMSTPFLSDSYDSPSRLGTGLTPPPMPTLSMYSRAPSQLSTMTFDHDQPVPPSTTSDSHYSDDEYEDGVVRDSMALSMTEGRPSFSSYSQDSPTTSTFQEMLNHDSYYNNPPSRHYTPRQSLEPSSGRSSRDYHYSSMSPPPRMSSSLNHTALSPPPRSSSFNYAAASRPSTSSSRGRLAIPPLPIVEDSTLDIVAPGPATPPLPIDEISGSSSQSPLSLDIPPHMIHDTIHSAPGALSPTSFFDTIQTHPNAMDDLESSDEEDDVVVETLPPRPRPPFSDPRARAASSAGATAPRPAIMKLGNHSMPYVSPSKQGIENLAAFDKRKPIANVPVRQPFFTDRKSDQGHGITSSTFDFHKYTQEHPPATTSPSDIRRPSTGEVRAQESLRKLDGMLIQHMETEKDTIKRIATTLKQTTKGQNTPS